MLEYASKIIFNRPEPCYESWIEGFFYRGNLELFEELLAILIVFDGCFCNYIHFFANK